jgi:WD40 repeat protein/energy-coupling factor transporter ATP-binding protein EcfA2
MNDAARTNLAGDDSTPKQPESPIPPPKYPYPGLRPFKTEEVDIFYGRNSQKDAILERLNQSHMVFVLGSSGCGKSSLIKAGVIPALKAGLLTRQGHDWQVIAMQPGRNPLISLAEAFSHTRERAREPAKARLAADQAKAKLAEGQAKSEPAGDLAKAESAGDPVASGRAEFLSCFENLEEGLWSASSILLETLAEGSRKNNVHYLLLVDQFEEIFGNQIENLAEVDRFVKLLSAQYARPHPALFVVFTMRSDYLGNCSSFPGLSEAVNNCSYLTPILTATELREAIVRPAWDYHAGVEDQLVEQILGEMHAGTNYDSDNLPLMQHALLWLWQRATDAEPNGPADSASRVLLTAEEYRASGGMKGILNKHAEYTLEIATGNDDKYQSIAEAFFRRLSERDEQGRFRRCPATFAEIKKIAACRDDELERVVAPFTDEKASFIEIRPADVSDDRLLDVSHEALIRSWDRTRQWAIQEHKKIEKFRLYLHSATAWRDSGRKWKLLKGEPDLGEFERWWQGSKPSGGWFGRYFASDTAKDDYPCANKAVAWVNRYRRASLQADRFLKRGAGALAVLAAAFIVSIPLYLFSEKARIARSNAEFARTIAESAREDLLRARARNIALRAEYALTREGPAKALLIATQPEKLGLPDLPGTERVLFAALRQLREKRVISGLLNPVTGIAYSPDGSVIASLNNRSLQFWAANDGTPIDILSLPAAGSFGVTWSADGDWIGVNMGNSALLLRPCSHEKIRSLFPTCRSGAEDQSLTLGDSENAGGLPRFSEDGKWAVTAPRTEPPVLWDIATRSGKRLAARNVPLPFDVAISPDKKMVALGMENSEISLIDPISGKTTQTLVALTEKSGNVLALEFNPKDSNMLAASLQNGHILIWDIKGNAATPLVDAGGIAYNLSFSPDGKFVTTSSDDQVIRTWSTDIDRLKNKPVEIRGHAGPVYVFAYSPDGKALASGSADKTIRIWDVHSPLWRDVETGPPPTSRDTLPARPPWGPSISLPSKFGDVVAYANEGDRAVVASKDGNLALFMVGGDRRPIVSWQAPEPIAGLSIERSPDRIVAILKSGTRYYRPFFPGIRQLDQFADDHIPFDGDHRLTLSDEEKCAISPPDDGCPSDEALSDFR